jgi:hypothetical protein
VGLNTTNIHTYIDYLIYSATENIIFSKFQFSAFFFFFDEILPKKIATWGEYG